MNEPPTDLDAQSIAVFASAGVAFFFTLVWMGVAAWTGIRYVRIKEGEPVHKPTVVLWLVSLSGVFTGPCVLLFSLAGLIGGLWMWKRAPESAERTRAAAVGAAATSAVMVVMVLVMVLVLGLGGALGG